MLAKIGGAESGPPAELALVPYTETVHPALNDSFDRIRPKRKTSRVFAHTDTTAGKTYSIYRGDLHRHTELSWTAEGRFAVGCLPLRARRAGLDFLGISDHNEDAAETYLWWLSQKYATCFTRKTSRLFTDTSVRWSIQTGTGTSSSPTRVLFCLS